MASVGDASQTLIDALLSARRLEQADEPACVEAYFHVATETLPNSPIHKVAVAKLVETAGRFGRIDMEVGIHLASGRAASVLRFQTNGFEWSNDEFREFIPVGKYCAEGLACHNATDGPGTAFVVLGEDRRSKPLLLECEPFAATAMLIQTEGSYELHWYAPKVAAQQGLAYDRTAPIAFGMIGTEKVALEDYRFPSEPSAGPTLFMGQPYQRGKTPVIFVHGLASDASTWAGTINELRQCEDLNDRFQFWFFEYPSGLSVLGNAAALRQQIKCLIHRIDPKGTDPALQRMIIVGHSAGGLIAKAQCCASGNRLWDAAFKQSLADLKLAPEVESDLKRDFYFEPSSRIDQVIYIATPHRGSVISYHLPARLATHLVQTPQLIRSEHRDLLRNNPHSVRWQLRHRMPTCVDLLKPNSQILQALDACPIAGNVRVDSIIGFGHSHHPWQDSDGVVAVSSATDKRSTTETFINAKHTKIKSDPATINQLIRLLSERCP
ncbi:alpha/beta fold hydrolase [Planctomycetes bacterium TBK1r]|uniref:esterase/lipase family protein n=1 Tax=Stieleria magnilauensis TaxID=2527963 RepID=UPI0011A0B272